MRVFLKGVLLVLVLAAIGWLLWMYQNGKPEPQPEPEPEKMVQDAQHLVDQDWIAFEIPKTVTDPALEIEMQLLGRFDRIDVVWIHPATEETDEHSLQEFQPGNTQARYIIDPRNGNILPGENQYTIIAYQGEEESTLQKEVSVSLEYDLTGREDVNPDRISFSDVPDEVDGDSLSLEGTLDQGVERMQVTSFNPRSGKATFTLLNQYESGSESFVYNAEERYHNLSSGDNIYVFETFDEEDYLISRKTLTIFSSKLTVADQVEQLFGDFERIEGGWYASTEKPWFLLRPTYRSVYYESSESSVVLPRPTLMYSAEADLSTELCDYLSGKDYEEEGVIYRGYSYETCQQYRLGVSVHDRFLSVLKTTPVLTIPRTQYQEVSDTVSSAFVMIETGGMPEPETDENDDALTEETVDLEAEADMEDEQDEMRYYVYQMLITDEVPYEEKQIGDIEVELSEERRQEIETLRGFLSAHSGDELFSELLMEK